MIQNATRAVADTEEVGMEITSELARNREKIESSKAKVQYSSLCLIFSCSSLDRFYFVLFHSFPLFVVLC